MRFGAKKDVTQVDESRLEYLYEEFKKPLHEKVFIIIFIIVIIIIIILFF